MNDTFRSVLDLLVGEPVRRPGLIELIGSLASRSDDEPSGPPPSAIGRRTFGLGGLQRLVQRFGLRVDPARGAAWSTTVDGVTLVLEIEPKSARELVARVTIPCPEAPDLLVMDQQQALAEEGDIRTGDVQFDRRVFVATPDPTVLGAFDLATRNALLGFVSGGGWIAGGALRLGSEALDELRAADAEAMVARMMAIAARLAVARPERLANLLALIRTDPDPAVRARLHALFGGDAEVRAAGAGGGGADDVAPQVRILDPYRDRAEREAALSELLASPDAGPRAPLMRDLPAELVPAAVLHITRALERAHLAPPVGLALVAYLDHNPTLDDAGRARLLAALGHTRDASVASWVAQVCDAPSDTVAGAALGALMRLPLGFEAALALMSPIAQGRARVLAPAVVEADPTLGTAFLSALFVRLDVPDVTLRRRYLAAFAAVGDPAAADVVARALGDADEATRLAAIDALGALGGPAHVALLDPRAGHVHGSDAKARAREAVAAIHARIGTHLRGGVALADRGAAGAVSLAAHEATSADDE